tara:strand:- start:1729 stop:2775 length:1047 start_codon:yes stop_codon:yes gene_type:complete
MKLKKNKDLPLDEFINQCLYDEKFGYYMKKNPFGKKGDFITAPNVSRLFSEMIAVWVVSFWEYLGSPKRFNLIELGAGNGEMMKILLESFQNFPLFLSSCNFIIHEKSPFLKKIQKKKLNRSKITWYSQMNKIKKIPSVFIANEFFDALPIKQFKKKDGRWYENYVRCNNSSNISIFEKEIEEKKIEIEIDYKIFKNQNFVEYSKVGHEYLKKIAKIIKKNSGGLLIIDYGYANKKMKDTLQAVSNHKFANILKDIGEVDITHNINFDTYKNFSKRLGGLETNITTQREFLIKMGIKERAEIISKNLNFTRKADIFLRLKRLIDKNEMGELFKVMFVRNKINKFKLGF